MFYGGPSWSGSGRGEGKGDLGGKLGQWCVGVSSNCHHQLGELLRQSLHEISTENLRLEEKHSTHMVTVIALPQTQLQRGRER